MSARSDGADLRGAFDDVQRIVLRGSHWGAAQHLVLEFGEDAQPPHFLSRLLHELPPTPAKADHAQVQLSLGLSRLGLERLRVPRHVLASLAAKAQAFSAGAALRACSHLGATGVDTPPHWEPAYGHTRLHAVISLHAMDEAALDEAVLTLVALAQACRVTPLDAGYAKRLPALEGQQLVHFGFRDGLSPMVIEGWTLGKDRDRCLEVSRHAAGEFVLGHQQACGGNPWRSTGGGRALPQELRDFFHNGSFGVLHRIEQDVPAFEAFVAKQAEITKLTPDIIKGKLCGRTPAGLPLAAAGALPTDDFDYTNDPDGLHCPFGSHVRRMNPRNDRLAHDRARPLIRRGMPYGPTWNPHRDDGVPRGLMGQFFCASIEDQFEHLIGQWADRVPLGSWDRGGARDPLIGAHQTGDGGFEIPLGGHQRPLVLQGLSAYTRTRGIAYLFYPSLKALALIARNNPFVDTREDWE